MEKAFHGRTLGALGLTWKEEYRKPFMPLIPGMKFARYNDIESLKNLISGDTAAVIIEAVQGEAGVILSDENYLKEVRELTQERDILLIVDEIQTGFCRTGPMFVTGSLGVKADFLTMAKGLAGGFPFGAFAMSERVTSRLELGDHGGTYCGNPLGCAVAYAVINYLIDQGISENVERMGLYALDLLSKLKRKYSDMVVDVRGKGLLLFIEFINEETAGRVSDKCLSNGLFVRQTQHTGIRIFPALNIRKEEMEEGLGIFEKSIKESV